MVKGVYSDFIYIGFESLDLVFSRSFLLTSHSNQIFINPNEI